MRGAVNAPLVIDSTELPVLEAALKLYGGKPIINSINFEDGEEAADKRLELARRFGAAVIALTIDEAGHGQGGRAQARGRASGSTTSPATSTACRRRDLLFDPLTFTICTGNEDDRKLGLDTLDAIERIAQSDAGVPDHPRPLEHLVRPQPAGAARAELGVSRPRAEARPDRRDRAFLARSCRCTRSRRRRCGSPRI